MKNSVKIVMKNIFVFFLIFLMFLLLLILMGGPKSYWDGWLYWSSGDTFWLNGNFSFTNYSVDYLYRGYFLPLWFNITRMGATAETTNVWLYIISNSLMWTVLIYKIIPGIMKKLFNASITGGGQILLCLVSLIFWYGVVINTLSDSYALFFLLISVYLLLCLKDCKASINKIISCFVIGCCIYIAYNIRTMYIVSFIIIALTLFYCIVKDCCGISIKIIMVGLFTVGVLFAAIPQMQINYKYMNMLSLMVPTETFSKDNKENLYELQLLWGLEIQRYETYIGDDYPLAGLKFADPMGKELKKKISVQDNNEIIISLVKLFARHPVEVIGIYAKHFFNALDNRFPEIYISDLDKNRNIYVILNYLIIYIFLISVCFNFSKGKNKSPDVKLKYSTLAGVLLPSLMATAGAIEIRFYIPVWFFIYAYIIFAVNYKELLVYIKQRWPLYAAGFFLGLLAVSSIWSSCMSNLPNKIIM